MKQGRTALLGAFLLSLFLIAMGTGAPVGNEKGRSPSLDRDGLVGNMAPDFTLKDIKGNSVTLSAKRGKIVLLNFWATWCPPCKSEMPSFEKLFLEGHDRGIEVIAVSADRSAKDVRDYLNKNRFGFTFLLDETNSVIKLYRVFSMPTTFLIDRNGIIAEKFMGEYEWTSPEMRNKLDKLR